MGQIKQLLVYTLMDNSEEKMCMLLEEWERQKHSDTQQPLKKSKAFEL